MGPRGSLSPREGKKISAGSVSGEHALADAGIGAEGFVSQQLHRQPSAGVDLDDLSVFAVQPRVGTQIAFRSSAWSASEKALMPSYCAFALPIMTWRHQFWIAPCETCATGQLRLQSGPVGTVRKICARLSASALRNLSKTSIGGRRIALGLERQRRHGAQGSRLCDPALWLVVPLHVAGDLAAAGRVSDVDCSAPVKVLHNGRSVDRVLVHRMLVRDLTGPATTSSAIVCGEPTVAWSPFDAEPANVRFRANWSSHVMSLRSRLMPRRRRVPQRSPQEPDRIR